MLMENKYKYLLVILLCICLSPFVLGQNKSPNEQASGPVQLVKAPKTDNQPDHNSQESLLSFVQEEPIVLLLSGLVLLAGATTLRRIRSGSRKQTASRAETSI